MKNEKGFSLIELMIVVAIIGILAAIAVPNFQKYQAKSRQSEAKSLLTGIFTAEKAWAAEWTSFSGDFGKIGFAPEGDLRYNAGFSGSGPAVAANYTGPNPATDYQSTSAYCPGAGTCTDVSGGDTTNFAAPTATAFIAAANGDVDGDATLDNWTINENKQLRITGANDLDD